MRYVLDTTFLIDCLRGLPAAKARLRAMFESGDAMLINETAVCEAASGARPEGEDDLAALIEPLEFIQPGPDTAIRAGRWRMASRRAGATLSVPDALIAAAAFDSDAAVLTRNVRDFALTPVRVETY